MTALFLLIIGFGVGLGASRTESLSPISDKIYNKSKEVKEKFLPSKE